MSLRIQCLGPFRVWKDEQDITAAIRHIGKADTLLKVLLSEPGRNFSQDELVEALWGERIAARKTTEKTAAGNLRRRLSAVRTLLESALKEKPSPEYILTTIDGYMWNPKAAYHLDVEEFFQQYEQARTLQERKQFSKAVTAYETAHQLVHGDYLEDERSAEWASPLRQRWRETHTTLFEQLADCYARLGQYRHAIDRCRAVLQLESSRESTYRQLMLYYYLSGNQTEALATYELCVKMHREQGVGEPDAQTKTLAEQIRAGHVPTIDKLYKPTKRKPFELPYTLSPGSMPFVGREAELAQLVDQLKQARRGRGSCVLVSGEAGVGKTRLIQELLAYAQRQHRAKILHGHKSGHSGSLLWTEIIGDRLNELEDKNLAEIQPLWLAEVAKLVPTLKERVPNLPENPTLSPPQEQLRFFEALVQFLLYLADHRSDAHPLVLALDDLHWADAVSLDFLNYLLPRIETKPIFIIGAYRSEEITEGHPLREVVKAGEQKKQVHLLSVSRLTFSAVGELLSKLPLKVKQASIFFGRLYEETEGNPLFLIATLQDLFEQGTLKVQGKSWVAETEHLSVTDWPLSPTVEDLILRRIKRLSELEEKLLSLLAVIGQDVEPLVLERAWDGEQEAYRGALGALTKKHLLIEQLDRYRFSHDKIREVIYGQMSPPRRQLLHQRVLHVLEQLYIGKLESGVGLLTHHAHCAGEWKKALEYGHLALKKAVKAYRWHEALQLVGQGLEAAQKLDAHGEDGAFVNAQRFALLVQRVDMCSVQGRWQEQTDDLTRLQELAEQIGDKSKKALIHQKRGELYQNVASYQEAEAEALLALQLYQEIEDRQNEALCQSNLANTYFYQGRYEEALRFHQQALNIRRASGDRQGQGTSLNNIGNVYWGLGQYQAASDYYQQALQLRREIRDLRGQGTSLNNVGLIHYNQGQYERALDYYQQALEIRREIGDRRGQSDSLNDIGNTYWSQGRYEDALRYYQETLHIRQEIRDPQGEGVTLNNLGAVYFYQGRYDEAMRYYEQGLEKRREVGDRRGQGDSLNNIGLVYQSTERYQEALRYHQQALEIHQEIDNQWGRADSAANLGSALLQLGQPTEALRYFREARSMFEKAGAKGFELMCLSMEGMAQLAMGENESAIACSSQAIHILESGHSCDVPQDVYFNHARILAVSGKSAEAASYLQRAHAELMQRAAHIKDKETQESFLQNVKTNREIMEAWHKNRVADPP